MNQSRVEQETSGKNFFKNCEIYRKTRASLIAQLVKNLPAMQRPWYDSWVRKNPWRRDKLYTPVFLGFPYGSAGKESACNLGNLGLIPGLGICPGEGKGYPLQCSGLENSMDCIVHGITKSRTWSNSLTHRKPVTKWYACIHAQSLQLCSTLCDPVDGSPPGSSHQRFWDLWCIRDSPGKNTGVGCHSLLQGIFLTQGLNPHLLHLLHWQVGSSPLAPPGYWLASQPLQAWTRSDSAGPLRVA